MPTEIDLSCLEAVRGLESILVGYRLLFLVHAERLEGEPPGPDHPNTEEPEQGAALLASELRCLVADAIHPALDPRFHSLDLLELLLEASHGAQPGDCERSEALAVLATQLAGRLRNEMPGSTPSSEFMPCSSPLQRVYA